jgi:hypothetical protein
MIIGGFAATMYGITRTTFDIDIVVDLKEAHGVLALFCRREKVKSMSSAL